MPANQSTTPSSTSSKETETETSEQGEHRGRGRGRQSSNPPDPSPLSLPVPSPHNGRNVPAGGLAATRRIGAGTTPPTIPNIPARYSASPRSASNLNVSTTNANGNGNGNGFLNANGTPPPGNTPLTYGVSYQNSHHVMGTSFAQSYAASRGGRMAPAHEQQSQGLRKSSTPTTMDTISDGKDKISFKKQPIARSPNKTNKTNGNGNGDVSSNSNNNGNGAGAGDGAGLGNLSASVKGSLASVLGKPKTASDAGAAAGETPGPTEEPSNETSDANESENASTSKLSALSSALNSQRSEGGEVVKSVVEGAEKTTEAKGLVAETKKDDQVVTGQTSRGFQQSQSQSPGPEQNGLDSALDDNDNVNETPDSEPLVTNQSTGETFFNSALAETKHAQQILNAQKVDDERQKLVPEHELALAGSGQRGRRGSRIEKLEIPDIRSNGASPAMDESPKVQASPSPSSSPQTSPTHLREATGARDQSESESAIDIPTSLHQPTPIPGWTPTSNAAPKGSLSASPNPNSSAVAGESAISQFTAGTSISDVPEEEKIRILRRHLVSADERRGSTPGAGLASTPGSTGGGESASATPPQNAGEKMVPTNSNSGTKSPLGRSSRANSSSNQIKPGVSFAAVVAAGTADGKKTEDAESVFSNGFAEEGETNMSNGAGGPQEGISARSLKSGGENAENASGFASNLDRAEGQEDEEFPIPYDAVGGDITHGIYKWQQSQSQPFGKRRSLSFSGLQRDHSMSRTLDSSFAHIHEPGGFRRQFVINRAVERGEEEPRVLKSFIDFLYLYGHFAGEDLEEVDDESDEEDTLPTQATYQEYGTDGEPISRKRNVRATGTESDLLDERVPLIGSLSRSASKIRGPLRRSRSKSVGPHGDASVTQAVLMLLKGFVGTGVLFLGKAFFNGGILFSTIVLLGIAAISLWSFLLLVKTRLVIPGSFGDIGGILYGNAMRSIILSSIALSQIGFVAAYTIFVAENLQAFVLAVSNCKQYITIKYLIAAQLIIFLPLSMIRNLAALSSTALIADAFILVGLLYIGGNEISVIASQGIADVQLFNKNDFSLLIGTAVFAFEGIGLIIPITEAMKEPHKFPKVLTGVMIGVAALFTTFGVLGYAAYGSDIQTVVIVNLPQDKKFVQVTQFLYTVAIILSSPLQLFPAVRIMENGLFSRSGKHNPKVKWQKNIFRAGTVLTCSLISWAGASNLDAFVSLIGSFACVPLCFIYPPLLHLRARAKTRTQKVLDIALIIFGILTTLYTTTQTLRVLARPSSGGEPKFGICD